MGAFDVGEVVQVATQLRAAAEQSGRKLGPEFDEWAKRSPTGCAVKSRNCPVRPAGR
jgi:hypothetical protein